METDKALSFRRYKDGDHKPRPWQQEIFQAGWSHKCPTYVHRTPPCQGSCPSGHDVRGWLNIVRGLDKPSDPNMTWQEYAFRKMTDTNPFPAVMGRVCPAPCEDGCNRNEVEDHVGINSIEHYIGNWAIEHKLAFPKPEIESGKKVAVIGGGPAGLSAAYHLRRKGHKVTIFEEHELLGGMMRYGIPGYRTPRDVLDAEIGRIIDMGGIEVRNKVRVGKDVTAEAIEKEFDAVFWGLGAQAGNPLEVPGGEVMNCVTGVAFLKAFNQGRLQHLHGKVLVIGGGDTAMDVATVARRLGHITQIHEKDRPEHVILGQTEHDVATIAKKEGADVEIIYRRPISKMPASKHELEAAIREGVNIKENLIPLGIVMGADGRAKALKVCPVEWVNGKMIKKDGQEFDIECSLIVAATGQGVDFKGIEFLDSGKGVISTDKAYKVPSRPNHFAGGDALKPHLLTTAIGHARIAAAGIDGFLKTGEVPKRPKVDVNSFNMLKKLEETGHAPAKYDGSQEWGTCDAKFAVHNYEDRSNHSIVPADELFLAHFQYTPRNKRKEVHIGSEDVLGNFKERLQALSEAEAIAEAKRCMSCGLCFECDNCMIFCPQTAVERVAKKDRTLGRYVTTNYAKCIGCHICMDVCPTGYIQMGLGE